MPALERVHGVFCPLSWGVLHLDAADVGRRWWRARNHDIFSGPGSPFVIGKAAATEDEYGEL